MAVQTFATIDIGSFDLELAIYEINSKGRIKKVDSVSYSIALGSDTYENGNISYELMDQLCSYINRFKEIMISYRVDPKNVSVFATSAMREAKNRVIVEDQIKVRCGLDVRVLSNSEQRYMCYEAIPIIMPEFVEAIKEDSAIVDVGYGSMQISMYGGGELKMTQNLRLGALRTQSMLDRLSGTNQDFKLITEELVANEIETFCAYYLGEEPIKNIIAVGDCMRVFAAKIMGMSEPSFISSEDYIKVYQSISLMSPPEIAATYELSNGFARLIIPVAMIYYRMLLSTGAEKIYVPCISLCDGVAADLAVKKHLIRPEHDFVRDIISSAEYVHKRFMGNTPHVHLMEMAALEIFDATKKIHGMGKRERLLLQLAAILHDVGKYISMTAPGQCGYDIIMGTELLGISHEEREIVANAVKYNTEKLERYHMEGAWSKERYLIIYKLSAILRLANALDRSHKQKINSFNMSVKDGKLLILAETDDKLILEKGLLEERSRFFEAAFGIVPEVRNKRKDRGVK